MSFSHETPARCVHGDKSSSSFSSSFSEASATSVGTSRSGGSRLLFGEINLSSDRSTSSYASVCNFVLCDSSTFLRFWLEDQCRETFLSYLSNQDLANLRLACHDFSVRAAPALFSDLLTNFKSNTFTKPARLAALDRLGFYVKTLTFNISHTPDTFLPPLVDPDTGAEMSFSYAPRVEVSTSKQPKYGDIKTTEILTRQWPTLFHAATNVPAFIHAFSGLVNLSHLTISCSGSQDGSRYRRSVVDYALISVRIAIERNALNDLESLTLSSIPASSLHNLSPVLGSGATPRSVSRWSRIRHLTIHADTDHNSQDNDYEQCKILQTYLAPFQKNLQTLNFHWTNTGKGPLPISLRTPSPSNTKSSPCLSFPALQRFETTNVIAPSSSIAVFLDAHKHSLVEFKFNSTSLSSGTWDDALAPLVKLARKRRPRAQPRPQSMLSAEIPIILAPSMVAAKSEFPRQMHRVERMDNAAKRPTRFSGWRGSKERSRCESSASRVREGLLEVEDQLRKVFRGSVFAKW